MMRRTRTEPRSSVGSQSIISKRGFVRPPSDPNGGPFFRARKSSFLFRMIREDRVVIGVVLPVAMETMRGRMTGHRQLAGQEEMVTILLHGT